MRLAAALALATMVITGGCGRDHSQSADAVRDTVASAGPLALLLDVPATVRPGEEVSIAVTLVNRGRAAVQVGAAAVDVVVTREDGTEVWQRSKHEPPSAAPASTSLGPNEMRGSGGTWDQRDDAGQALAPGTYRIRAELREMDVKSEERRIIVQP